MGPKPKLTYLDFWMIRSNTKTDKAIRHRKMLIHIYYSIFNFGEHFIGRIKARRARAYDGHSERSAICSGILYAILPARINLGTRQTALVIKYHAT